ncbi:MAG: FHA domain-containing protein [Chloroflexi bacterium]|nr:FHA domain-containing protein [Chloroflexota bacterium]
MAITSWIIELSSANMPGAMKVRLDERVIVGRAEKNQSTQPDVDLGPFGAESLGVSRQHLTIDAHDNHLTISDLNSMNGSMLNDKKLEPNKAYPLKHGDQVTLGSFKLNIAIVVSPTYGPSVVEQSSVQLQADVYPGSGQFILIVEDDPEIAKLISLIMEQAGYTTQTARDMLGAIRTFNARRPSAVIVDVTLPGLNGLEFCRYVRRDQRQNSMPIVVLGGPKTSESVAQSMQAGANIFIGRPINAQELAHAVTSLVQQHEKGVSTLHTRHLVGTAPLRALKPESRKDTAVIFVYGHPDTPITVSLKQAVTFGRQADKTTSAHVDLTRFQAVDLGVSRVHMVLHYKDNRFFVEDLGSVNGTFLNGRSIRPGQLEELENANEVRLGQLRMYIYFLTDEDKELE